MMSLLANIRREWRLFWTMEVLGFSGWLAVIGVRYLGDIESIRSQYDPRHFSLILHDFFVWVWSPGCIIMWALFLNFVATRSAEAYEGAKRRMAVVRSGVPRVFDVVHQLITENYSVSAALALWLFSGLTLGVCWVWELKTKSAEYLSSLVITYLKVMVTSFVVGLVQVTIFLCGTGHHSVPIDGSPILTGWTPILIGWGLGWVICLVLILLQLYLGDVIFEIFWSVTFPLGFFLFAKAEFFGEWVGGRIKHIIDAVQRRDGVLHWSLATCMQILMILWILIVYTLLSGSD